MLGPVSRSGQAWVWGAVWPLAQRCQWGPEEGVGAGIGDDAIFFSVVRRVPGGYGCLDIGGWRGSQDLGRRQGCRWPSLLQRTRQGSDYQGDARNSGQELAQHGRYGSTR